MGEKIKYSFIIPHKNTPVLLQRCLDSIPFRDDVEIIVVDNNSSHDIVDFDNYPGCNRKEVRIVRDNKSVGGGGARNIGLAHAKGKWILFADADDYYSEGFLDVLDRYSDSEIDILYFNQIVLKDGKVISRIFKYVDDYCDDNDNNILAIKYKHHVPWNKMVRRDFLIKYGISFEDCIAGNDILYSYLCGYYAKHISVERERLYNYVINANSVIHKKNNNSSYYVCIFSHLYQSNTFFEHINHVGLKRSVFSRFLSILLKKGVSQCLYAFCVFVKYRNIITSSKNYFMDKIRDTNV